MAIKIMDAKVKFAQYVVHQGLRHTDQRDQVLGVFLGTERHVTVQELYDLVRKKDKGIGYATVARTIKLMCDSGICRQVDFGDGSLRYEHKYGHEHHDHLICLKCGKFEEIYSPKLERIQNELVKKHGYIQENHKLDIFGLCPRCAKKHIRKKS
ncbi:MAG: Fur family transcriptional regulator [Planctomycetota bacterium]|jgi:Fur family ferric uptake transcriptional regulator